MQNQKKQARQKTGNCQRSTIEKIPGKRSFGWKTSWRRNRQRQTGRDWLAQTDLRSSWRPWQTG